MRVLLENGVEVNRKSGSNESTALHLAVGLGLIFIDNNLNTCPHTSVNEPNTNCFVQN